MQFMRQGERLRSLEMPEVRIRGLAGARVGRQVEKDIQER